MSKWGRPNFDFWWFSKKSATWLLKLTHSGCAPLLKLFSKSVCVCMYDRMYVCMHIHRQVSFGLRQVKYAYEVSMSTCILVHHEMPWMMTSNASLWILSSLQTPLNFNPWVTWVTEMMQLQHQMKITCTPLLSSSQSCIGKKHRSWIIWDHYFMVELHMNCSVHLK